MPKWYIGSTSLARISDGYAGTPKSKAYSKIWKQERKDNPNLFITIIVKEFETREEALQAEYEYQIACDVVKSEHYINMSVAAPNGFFGMNVTGANNAVFGTVGWMKGRSGELHHNYKKPLTEEWRANIIANRPNKAGANNSMYGKPASNRDIPHTQETRDKIGKANKGKLSGSKNPMFGKIRMNNGVINIQVLPEDVEKHLNQGFRKGISLKK